MGLRSEPPQCAADEETQQERSLTGQIESHFLPTKSVTRAEETKHTVIAEQPTMEDVVTSNKPVKIRSIQSGLDQKVQSNTSESENLSHNSITTTPKSIPAAMALGILENNDPKSEDESPPKTLQSTNSGEDEKDSFKSLDSKSTISRDSIQLSTESMHQDETIASQEETTPDNDLLPDPKTFLSKQLDQTSSPEHKKISHDSMATLKSLSRRSSKISTTKSISAEAQELPQKNADKPEDDEDEYFPESIQPTVSSEDENEKSNFKDLNSTITRQSIISKEPIKLSTRESYQLVTGNSQEKAVSDNVDSGDANALLLERLEQENKMHIANTKSSSLQKSSLVNKKLSEQTLSSSTQISKSSTQSSSAYLRYSKIPPPPMTELEFWGAVVKDYRTTAQRLPTLMTKKIRKGVPAPLRGVVWHSISGARNPDLASQYDRLCGEPSPYDAIIGKDLGRSFPGIEMFQDPNGDGQKMLGKVLKCFSLYDNKIGYCQGLAFLVGPFLMHMGDQQAFCVLVRLLDNYDLRSCFLPDLSGLHMRIFQFRQLLRQHLPNLSKHLDDLQIEPAYVSQWFLSIFAVSCPLPMLFRIYDVIFAEGAVNTVMRVALSLMRRNEQKIMAHSELENVMQLLLSRSLWDVYHYNSDDFVNDFVSLSDIVTPEILRSLESSFNTQENDFMTLPSNVDLKATQFLGKSLTGPTMSMKLTSPRLTTPSQPKDLLRRSSSKQSIASTLNSIEGSGTDSTISFGTGTTSISRASSNTDVSSILTQSVSFNQATKTNKDLHTQIEDLLTALSELQRENAIVATQLQKEREERDDDRVMVQTLLGRLQSSHDFGDNLETRNSSLLTSEKSIDDLTPHLQSQTLDDNGASNAQISSLLRTMELRFSPRSKRPSSLLQTKSQLREDLTRTKEQLVIETSKTQNFSSKLLKQDQEITELREQAKKMNINLRNAESENQKLDRQIKDLRKEHTVSRDNSMNSTATVGLRELRLGRPNSRNLQNSYSKRVSSLSVKSYISSPTKNAEFSAQTNNLSIMRSSEPDKENDAEALIIELVQAKTSEALARQEADELRNKLESLKKLLDAPVAVRSNPSQSISVGISNYFSGAKTESKPTSLPVKPTSLSLKPSSSLPSTQFAPPAPLGNSVAAVTGFLGGWGKRAIGNSFGS
ncbi:hypothetical protein K3495_g2748 [Podosphaera aphanis]|nr:hypothetical protein K3495_g2748 [Podosphaera aphanis]